MPDTATAQAQVLEGLKSFQQSLDGAITSIRTEKDLQSEVSRIGQDRSRFEHELQMKETALSEAKRQIVELQTKNRLSVQDASRLQSELIALRSQPVIGPEVPRLLTEQQQLSSYLQTEVSRLQGQISDHWSSSQLQKDEVQNLQHEIARLKEDLARSEEAASSFAQRDHDRQYEVNRRVEEMRQMLIRDAGSEKAAMVSRHSETILQHQATESRLRTSLNEVRGENTTLKESLAVAKASEKAKDQEILSLKNSQEAQDPVTSANNSNFDAELSRLKATNEHLRELTKEEKTRNTQLLSRLNQTITKLGGASFGNVPAAVDFILSTLLQPSQSETSASTGLTFYTAQSRMTPNTAVARTESRGSGNAGNVSDALDLLQTVDSPAPVVGAQRSQNALVPCEPQELPYNGRNRSLDIEGEALHKHAKF